MFPDAWPVWRIACREHRFVREGRSRVIGVSARTHGFMGDSMLNLAASSQRAAGRYAESIVGTAGRPLLKGAVCRASGLRKRRRPLRMPRITHCPVLTICRRGYRAPQGQAAIARSLTAVEPALVFSPEVGLKGGQRRAQAAISRVNRPTLFAASCESPVLFQMRSVLSLLRQSPELFSQ